MSTLVFCIFALLAACSGGDNGEAPAPPLPLPPPPLPPLTLFTDATPASGIDFVNGFVNSADLGVVENVAPSAAASGDLDIYHTNEWPNVDELTVQWPDGRLTVMTNVQAGQSITVEHPDL